jgi:hypothetical protein
MSAIVQTRPSTDDDEPLPAATARDADSYIQRRATDADDRHPGAGALLLRIDETIKQHAEPYLRMKIATRLVSYHGEELGALANETTRPDVLAFHLLAIEAALGEGSETAGPWSILARGAGCAVDVCAEDFTELPVEGVQGYGLVRPEGVVIAVDERLPTEGQIAVAIRIALCAMQGWHPEKCAGPPRRCAAQPARRARCRAVEHVQ